MRMYDVYFYDEETGQNFDFHTEVDEPTIAGDLNVFVAILRSEGYGDDLIKKMIGTTYFENVGFPDLDVAMQEAIDEYAAGGDARDPRLDSNAAHTRDFSRE